MLNGYEMEMEMFLGIGDFGDRLPRDLSRTILLWTIGKCRVSYDAQEFTRAMS